MVPGDIDRPPSPLQNSAPGQAAGPGTRPPPAQAPALSSLGPGLLDLAAHICAHQQPDNYALPRPEDPPSAPRPSSRRPGPELAARLRLCEPRIGLVHVLGCRGRAGPGPLRPRRPGQRQRRRRRAPGGGGPRGRGGGEAGSGCTRRRQAK
jgi:hypothetical protein